MEQLWIPAGEGNSEYIEKKSRFLGLVLPVTTEAEARAQLEAVKKREYDARHNCWAYVLHTGQKRYSDDGEPQGTAGQPMLKVLEREEVTNVCCVVTRYFGGILLGAGGLTRAYSKGAKDALIASGIAVMGAWARVKVPCTYPLFQRVKLEIESANGVVDDVQYGADVVLAVSLPAEQTEGLQRRLTELSAGQLEMVQAGEEFLPGPREDAK